MSRLRPDRLLDRLLAQLLARLPIPLRTRLLDETNRHLLVVFAGHALRLTLGLASSALLARGLGPAGLSTFSVLGAAMAITMTLGDFGLSHSAVRFVAGAGSDKGPQVAHDFARLKGIGALLVAFGLAALAPWLTRLLALPPDSGPRFLWLAALGVLATSTSGIVSTLLQALRRFGALVLAQTLNVTLTVLLVALLFVTQRLTIVSALWVGIVTALAGLALGAVLLPTTWRRALLRAPESGGTGGPGELLRFGKWLWLSSILAIVLAQLDLLLLNRLLSPAETGYYALALNLALKVDLLNQTLFTVLLPTASRLERRADLTAYARRSLRRTLPLALLLLLALPLVRPFVLLVYGTAYAPSLAPLYALLAIVLFDLLTVPLLLLAFPLDAPRLIAGSNALRVLTLLLAAPLLIPLWGLPGAALAKLLAKVAGALLMGGVLLWRVRRLEETTQ